MQEMTVKSGHKQKGKDEKERGGKKSTRTKSTLSIIIADKVSLWSKLRMT